MDLYKWLSDIAGSFQPTANRIRAWKLPPQVEKLFDEIWDNLPKNIQDSLWALIKKIADKYGEDIAIIVLNGFLNSIKNGAWLVKK